MHVSTTEVNVPDAMTIQVTDDALIAELSDGRTISVPLVLVSPTGPWNTRGTRQLGADRDRRGRPLA